MLGAPGCSLYADICCCEDKGGGLVVCLVWGWMVGGGGLEDCIAAGRVVGVRGYDWAGLFVAQRTDHGFLEQCS